MKETKMLTALFGVGVAGVAFCLVMTGVTAVQQHRQTATSSPLPSHAVAVPAVGG
jgi:hypothetical protein